MPMTPHACRILSGLALLPLLALLTGCSKIEEVRVINRFGQPIRLRIEGSDPTSIVPAHGASLLNKRYYLGSDPVRVTILTLQGRMLKVVDLSTSGGYWRRVAVIEVEP